MNAALLAAFTTQPWAIEQRFLEDLLERLAHAPEQEPAARVQMPLPKPEDEEPDYEVQDGVAIIPLHGMILADVPPIFSLFGIDACSTTGVGRALAAATADPACHSLLLHVSSPGGSVDGVAELADQLYAARSAGKPLAAHIEHLGASAAMWLAAQAGTVTANRTAQVGGIGVFQVVRDRSEQARQDGVKVHVIASGPYKGTGVPGAPVTDEQLKPIQENINGLHAEFVAAVARGRGLKPAAVDALATGRTWLAPAAQAAGLLDRVGTQAQALSALRPAPRPPVTTPRMEALMDPKLKLRLVALGLAATASDAEAKTFLDAKRPHFQAIGLAEKADDAAVLAFFASFGSGPTTPDTGASAKALQAMETAFPAHAAFARSQWEKGATLEQAKAAHYEVVLADLQTAKAATVAAQAEATAAKTELATLQATVAAAGGKPLPVKPPTPEQPADKGKHKDILAYDAKLKELEAGGDKRAEQTLAVKFPELVTAYRAAHAG